jgi:hypothetical protein
VQNNIGGHGGGIELVEAPPKVIRDTTIAHNHASLHPEPPWVGYGGGIWNDSPDVRLINVTLSDNWGQGGGIMNTGQMTVTNSTLEDNGSHAWGAAIYNLGALWVGNTIIGRSVEQASCDISRAGLLTLGHNVDTDGSCALQGSGDRSRLDARLAVLTDNGGNVWTHALLPDSPALDAADDRLCPAADARGKPRPYGPACDIGAFERTAGDPAPTPTPTPRPDGIAAYLPLAGRGPSSGQRLARPR